MYILILLISEMLIKRKAIIVIFNSQYKYKLIYNRILKDSLFIDPLSTILKIKKLQKKFVRWTYIFLREVYYPY